MTVSINPPNRILLAGREHHAMIVDTVPAIEAITPGYLLEYHNDSGVLKFGVHDAADDPISAIVALERSELNKGVDDAYAAGDLVKAAVLSPGANAWLVLPSGQTIVLGDHLQSNGDGKVKKLGTGVAKFVALEAKTTIADTRIRATAL